MANTRFNHAYNHCTSTQCGKHADCAHYLAYLEAIQLGLKDIKTVDHCDDLDLDYVRVRIE
jgi:hypothetical protein